MRPVDVIDPPVESRSLSDRSGRAASAGHPQTALVGSTALLASSIALGPRWGVVPVAIAALLWAGALGWFLVRGVGALPRDWWGWLSVVGISFAVLRMASLGLVQWLGGRDTLSWNVDWRYSATQAHSISRFAGSGDSTDYAGTPIEYHAGPSWIAGGLNHILGLPVNPLLFIVVPVMSMVLITGSAHLLLTSLGVNSRVSLLSVAVAVNLPTEPYRLAYDVYLVAGGRAKPSVLLNAESWWFTPNLMLNSMLGLGVGLLGLWALTSRATRTSLAMTVMGGVCLAGLIAIKPQYLIGFVAASGVGYLIDARRARRLRSWRQLLVVGAVIAPAALFSRINRNPLSFTEIAIEAAPLLSYKVLLRETLVVIAVAIIMFCLLVFVRRGQGAPRLLGLAAGAVVGWIVHYIGVTATTVLLDDAVVDRARSTGLDYARNSQDFNFMQTLLPVDLCLTLLATAALVDLIRRNQRMLATAGVVVGACLAFVTLPVSLAPLLAPDGAAAYEVAEESALDVVMSRGGVLDGVWVSSDLADPAEDFARPLRGVTLTSNHPAQFYVTNVAYGGITQPDVALRVANNDRFFSTSWSPWHQAFLTENDIHHVLVRDRCPASWEPGSSGLRLADEVGAWKHYVVDAGTPVLPAAEDPGTAGPSPDRR